jgi:disulfide oxidoreductase YuzD
VIGVVSGNKLIIGRSVAEDSLDRLTSRIKRTVSSALFAMRWIDVFDKTEIVDR